MTRPILTLKGRKPTPKPKPHPRDVLADLGRHWPVLVSDPPVPLAIGIDQQIKASAAERDLSFSNNRISQALRWRTGGYAYRRAIAAGVTRINLDGSPAGKPSDAEREQAKRPAAKARRSKKQRFADRVSKGDVNAAYQNRMD